MTSSLTESSTKLTWQLCSESNLALFFPKPISLHNQQKCWALAEVIEQLPTVQEVVIGMNTLSVFTKSLSWPQLIELQAILNTMVTESGLKQLQIKDVKGDLIEIPVRYGGRFGPDLQPMAEALGLTVQAVVDLHTKASYTVYFIGFQPGFPYLGGLPESLYFPRHSTPRTKVPAGSVGIGGEQTGIYPFESPGGWQLLGQTDTVLFNIQHSSPTLLKAGDSLRFVPIDIDDTRA